MKTENVKLIILNRPIQLSVAFDKVEQIKYIATIIDGKLKELQKKFPRKDVLELLLLMLIDAHLEKENYVKEQHLANEEYLRRLQIMHKRLNQHRRQLADEA